MVRDEARDLFWRLKILIGAAGIGGWLGFCFWVWWLAEVSGGSDGWMAEHWVKWALILLGYPWAQQEFAIAAGIGAATFSSPLFYLFFVRKRGV